MNLFRGARERLRQTLEAFDIHELDSKTKGAAASMKETMRSRLR